MRTAYLLTYELAYNDGKSSVIAAYISLSKAMAMAKVFAAGMREELDAWEYDGHDRFSARTKQRHPMTFAVTRIDLDEEV